MLRSIRLISGKAALSHHCHQTSGVNNTTGEADSCKVVISLRNPWDLRPGEKKLPVSLQDEAAYLDNQMRVKPVRKVVVHTANIQDREGVKLLLEPIKGRFPRISKVWVDNGYTGTGRIWIKEHMGWDVVVVSHPRCPCGMWVFPGQEIDWSLFERPKGFRCLPVAGSWSAPWFGRATIGA